VPIAKTYTMEEIATTQDDMEPNPRLGHAGRLDWAPSQYVVRVDWDFWRGELPRHGRPWDAERAHIECRSPPSDDAGVFEGQDPRGTRSRYREG